MPRMRRLTIIVATAERERFRAALSIALAEAALDRPVRIFLQEGAAALLTPARGSDETDVAAAGLPTLAELLDEALSAEIGFTICQSGLALAGASAATLPPGVEVGGLVGLLADAADDRLLLA
jgi:predicted peroxiredoxin